MGHPRILQGKALRRDQHTTGADQGSMNFRRENSTGLRERGKLYDKKSRTIWCFSKEWEASQSSASTFQNFLLNSAPQNLDAELNLPLSSDKVASSRA
ncbi:hypothetical protein [Alloyangia pacifica]|uniref:hypothetical protein n=1 Tax=Alloyangia pacifica TaxID=311180 RepID=UPI001CD6CD9D|nr:hypothetical protein [Alloyangia pacifica]MCA0997022.1 hypothetical protein [Alloyangia pacifica]